MSGNKNSTTAGHDAGFRGSEATPLGIHAKSSPPPPDEIRLKGQLQRAERYALLAEARRLLTKAAAAQGARHANKFHRTTTCMHCMQGGLVGVHLSQNYRKAFFSGLATCGSVWSCPVCAAKVQERRREEIRHAVDWAYALRDLDDFTQAGKVHARRIAPPSPFGLAKQHRERGINAQPVMVTLTFPHRAWHKLETLIPQHRKALSRLRKGKAWDKRKARWGFRYLIRSMEVTHGRNGWHPHTHELWFVSPRASAEEMRGGILKQWRTACEKAGLLDVGDAGFDDHAVDVKGWCSAGEYLAKQDDARHWGVDSEMAKASTKGSKATKGGRKGLHPFGLLSKSLDGDEKAGRLFVEFSRAMKKHRVRQVFWGQGFKKKVRVQELTDEQLAERQEDKADLLGQLDIEEWKVIRRAGAQAEVLNAAESKGGWSAVKKVLEKCIARCNNKASKEQYILGDQNGSEREGKERGRVDDTPTRIGSGQVRGDMQRPRHQRLKRDTAVHPRDAGEACAGQAEALSFTLEDAGI